MLQDTAARGLSDVGFAAPLLVCNEDHRFLVDDQLRQIGIKPQAILLEPQARNTGPAIAAAALWLLARDPDALMLVQPSDHVIASPADFHRAVMRGIAAAQAGRLVTFGVKPSRARHRLRLHPERRGARAAPKACSRSIASSRSPTARPPSASSTAAPSSGTAASSC